MSFDTTIIWELWRASKLRSDMPAADRPPRTRSTVTSMVCSENVSRVSRRSTSVIQGPATATQHCLHMCVMPVTKRRSKMWRMT